MPAGGTFDISGGSIVGAGCSAFANPVRSGSGGGGSGGAGGAGASTSIAFPQEGQPGHNLITLADPATMF